MSLNGVGANIWNIASGAIGALAFVSCLWTLVQNQHPEIKLAELESTLKDTEALLRSITEEGLLHPVRDVPHFEFHLTSCEVYLRIS